VDSGALPSRIGCYLGPNAVMREALGLSLESRVAAKVRSIFLYIRSANLWVFAWGTDAPLPVAKEWFEIANQHESLTSIPVCRMRVCHIFPHLVTELGLRGNATA
jgi:hypothetical protein